MSSFSDDFLDALEPDLRTALSLTGDAVHRGRQPRAVTSPGALEVWIEPREVRSQQGGLGGTVAHNYRLHLRLKSVLEPNRTGASQHDTLAGHEQTVRRRYDGSRAFYSVTDFVCMSVGESFAGESEGQLLDRYTELTALERC